MDVVFDIETRSECDLKKCGVYVYAKHPTTQVICASVKIVGAPKAYVWYNGDIVYSLGPGEVSLNLTTLDKLRKVLRTADKVIAHNAAFEREVWNACIGPDLRNDTLHCTMASCAMKALPQGLDSAGKALRLDTRKDNDGHKLMLKMCKPRKPRKAEREADPDWENKLWWHEEPEQILRLCKYCIQDVLTEEQVWLEVGELPVKEREVWILDQKINARGIAVNPEEVKPVIHQLEKCRKELLKEFIDLTDGTVTSPRAYVALRDWVNERISGEVENLNKETTDKLLARQHLPANVRQVLEIKTQAGKSSTAKLSAIVDMAGEGNRMRGTMCYHGASTGRWAGRGVQPHNLPRDSYPPATAEKVLSLFREGDMDTLSMLYDLPFAAASKLVRALLCVGEEVTGADYSAIEGRGLAWLAGEQWVLDAYREGIDLYCVNAGGVFNIRPDQVSSGLRQVGKVMELALGYGGGIGALATMAAGYGLNLESLPSNVIPTADGDTLSAAKSMATRYLRDNEDVMSHDAATACDILKRKWRESRPRTVMFWKKIEEAALAAILNKGTYAYRKITFQCDGPWLTCRLPSGRLLWYREPKVSIRETDWGERQTITYMGMKSVGEATTTSWCRVHTYGGKLAENITQAHCRDILADAMLRIDPIFPVVMHVHDEIESTGSGPVSEFERLMSVVPAYAEGMPICVESWRGERYRK